eukprot:gene3771-15053_t
MWFIVVTCRSLMYTLISIGTLMLVFAAIATPKWLIGKVERSKLYGNTTYRQSVGIYNRCTHVNNLVSQKLEPNCGIYATSFMKIDSKAWQACIVFLGIAIVLLGIAAFFAIMAFCKQICMDKSVLNLAGVLQGLCLSVALITYPVGWTSARISRMCHGPNGESRAFQIGQCQLGISYYFAIASCVGAFLGCLLSGFADRSIFSSDVQEEILEGKHLICVP